MIHKYLAKTATCHLCEGTAIPYIKHVIGASIVSQTSSNVCYVSEDYFSGSFLECTQYNNKWYMCCKKTF